MIKPSQCRAARGLLDWSQQRLAKASNIGNATIRNFEAGRSFPQFATLDVLQRTFVASGIIFIEENGEGPGVRMRKVVGTEGSSSERAASAGDARDMALGAIDRTMADSSATNTQKENRAEKLTEYPSIVEDARGKRRPDEGIRPDQLSSENDK